MEQFASKWSQRSNVLDNDVSGQVVSTKNIWIRSLKLTQDILNDAKTQSRLKLEKARNTELCDLCKKYLPPDSQIRYEERESALPSISNVGLIDSSRARNPIRDRKGKRVKMQHNSHLFQFNDCDDREMLFPSSESKDYCNCPKLRHQIEHCPNSYLREDRDEDVVRFCRFAVDEDEDLFKRTLRHCCNSSGDKYLTYTYILGKFEKKNLSLANHGLTESWGAILGELVRKSSHITYLDLSGNSLGEDGVKQLAKGLDLNFTVQKVDLSGNDLGNSLALASLASVIDGNETITELTLSRNNLTDLDIEPLISACTSNTVLRTLNLHANRLKELSSNYLKMLLKNNATLEVIDIGCNDLGPTGIKYIFEGLEANCSLKKLILSTNSIGDRGMDELNTITSLGSELSYLDLADNLLTDYSIKSFARFFTKTNSLSGFRLDENPFSSTGLLVLLQHVLRCKEILLTHLSIGNVFLDDQVRNLIHKIQTRKQSFQMHGGYGVIRDSSNAFRVLDSYLARHAFLADKKDLECLNTTQS